MMAKIGHHSSDNKASPVVGCTEFFFFFRYQFSFKYDLSGFFFGHRLVASATYNASTGFPYLRFPITRWINSNSWEYSWFVACVLLLEYLIRLSCIVWPDYKVHHIYIVNSGAQLMNWKLNRFSECFFVNIFIVKSCIQVEITLITSDCDLYYECMMTICIISSVVHDLREHSISPLRWWRDVESRIGHRDK